MLMIGTGHLAPWMVRAHYALRPSLERVWVWGRSLDRARAMAERLQADGIPAEAEEDLEWSVRAADLVSCATTSRERIVRGEWQEHADTPHPLALLRARSDRPCRCRAAEERYERAPLHRHARHSITSSARQ